jgi:ABC-type multidrug transport system fused ATPase/permease subunit
LAPYRFRLTAATALAIAACSLALVGPLLIQRLLTGAGRGHNLTSLIVPACLLAIAVILHAILSSTNSWLLGSIALEIGRKLRLTLYSRLHQMPVAWFDRTPGGAIISRLMDDVAVIQGIASSQTLVTLIDLGIAFGAAMWLCTRSWKLALVIILIVPLYAVIFRFFTRRIRAGSFDIRRQLDQLFGGLKQKIDGIHVIRATAAEAAEISQFTRQIGQLHVPRLQVNGLGISFSNLCAGLGGIGASLLFAIGAAEVSSGQLTVGELIAACVLCGLLFAPIARFSDLAAQYHQAFASFTRLGELLNQPIDGDLLESSAFSTQITAPARLAGAISFRHVSFAYVPGQPVLKDFSLHIKAGSKVALVGRTGSGKTTVMNLLLRFYEPSTGCVFIDDQPLCEYSNSSLRQHIGVVSQEPVIFRGTLADNIHYGTPAASSQQITAAAEAALIHDFALSLPEKYKTFVGEGGHPLSQGQRQLIALARLFCKDPSIILLDEATSSLDRTSETLVQQALDRLLAGRTTLIIAHRLATVQAADAIVVMDDGQIVETESHANLLAAENGVYRRLHDSQLVAPDNHSLPIHSRRQYVAAVPA